MRTKKTEGLGASLKSYRHVKGGGAGHRVQRNVFDALEELKESHIGKKQLNQQSQVLQKQIRGVVVQHQKDQPKIETWCQTLVNQH